MNKINTTMVKKMCKTYKTIKKNTDEGPRSKNACEAWAPYDLPDDLCARALLSSSRDELARVSAGMSADAYERLARAPRRPLERVAIFFGLTMAVMAIVWLLAVWLAASAPFSNAVATCDAPAGPAPARTLMGMLKMAATRVGALKPEVVLLPPSDPERYMCILRKASVVLP